MKRILIVDDEYIVRLGLKTVIDWAEYGCIIAGEAANGKEALEYFERNGADVILTDIKMPVMDGLELTRAIKERDKKVQIIILSHYDEFAYAREALRFGAFRYILKSELTKPNLAMVLKSLFHEEGDYETESEIQHAGDNPSAKLESYIEENLFPYFSNEAVSSLKLPLPDIEIFRGELILLFGFCRVSILQPETRKKFPKTVKVLIDEAFPGMVFYGNYQNENFKFIALLPHQEDIPDIKNRDLCIRIVKNVRQYYDVNIFMGLSTQGKQKDMRRLLNEALTAIGMCFFSEKNFVTPYSADLENKPLKITPMLAQETLLQAAPTVSYTILAEMIDMNKKEAMLEYIQNIFRELRKIKKYMMVHDVFIDFLSIGKSIREKYALHETASLSENKFNYDIFYNLGFIGDVEFYIYGVFLALLAAKQSGQIGYSHIVKNCISFIQKNYEKNISLSEAATNIEVSHSYLSFIFKQEAGINFNTYLSQHRVERAKKLLRSTNMRIYEVAEKVGFSNPYYFSKVFKELTGVSCKEFRDSSN